MNQPPFPPQRPRMSTRPQADNSNYQELHQRLGQMYGAFGGKPQEVAKEVVDIDWTDNWRKQTLTLALSTLALSAFFTYGLGTETQLINLALLLATMGALYVLLWKKPLTFGMRTVLVLITFVESFAELANWWTPPMKMAANLLYGGMKEAAGVPGMSLSLYFFVVCAMIWRGYKQRRKLGMIRIPRIAWSIPITFLSTVAALILFGLARGDANITALFFQVLQLFTLPLVAAMWLLCMRGREDFPAIGAIIVVTALLRSALVVVTYLAVAHDHSHREGFFVTTHSDSVLFATAYAIALARALEVRTKEAIVWAIAITLSLLVGIAFNNRRVALIHLGLASAVMYAMMKPNRTKRRVTALILVAGALFAGYVLVGAKVEGEMPIFKPARLVMSVFEQTDTSSTSRVVENFNLVFTFRDSPYVGHGFGHEYLERYAAFDLTDLFALYKYIPHNGLLWLWSVAGLAFIPWLWLIYVGGLGLAVHAYRVAPHPADRIASMAAATVVVTALTQSWGDQGLHSNLTLSLLTLSYAVCAHICIRQEAEAT